MPPTRNDARYGRCSMSNQLLTESGMCISLANRMERIPEHRFVSMTMTGHVKHRCIHKITCREVLQQWLEETPTKLLILNTKRYTKTRHGCQTRLHSIYHRHHKQLSTHHAQFAEKCQIDIRSNCLEWLLAVVTFGRWVLTVYGCSACMWRRMSGATFET